VPELPEVETIVRGLRPALEGSTVVRARVWRPNVVVGSPRRFERAVTGRRIERVGRRAKLLRFDLDDGRVWWTSLRMTGHYRLDPRGGRADDARFLAAAARAEAPSAGGPAAGPTPAPAYARAAFDLAGGERLWYVDVRTLGKLGVIGAAAWSRRERELGPEPLDPSFTAAELAVRLRRTRRRIKEVLLDQRILAGVGNIYASEALYRAGIDPRTRADRVGGSGAQRLHEAIRGVLSEAIEHEGTTIVNYAGANGEGGAFADRLRVYDREDERCPRCGAPVRRIVQAQRSTYFCPACQRRR
jgi:formamidopyrimidine-DNA glycosylase